jgi:hypothetical protein
MEGNLVMENRSIPDVKQPGSENPPKEGVGDLVVFVSTSMGGYPITNATVTVYNEEGPQKFKRVSLQTGRDGKASFPKLPAPVLTPQELYECKTRAYAVYTVSVEYPRFYTNIHKDVQVFANIEAILNSFLMPLPANIGQGSTTKIYLVPPTRCLMTSEGPRGAAEEETAQELASKAKTEGGGK